MHLTYLIHHKTLIIINIVINYNSTDILLDTSRPDNLFNRICILFKPQKMCY